MSSIRIKKISIILLFSGFLNTAFAGSEQSESQRQIANKALISEFIEAFNNRGFDTIERLVAKDFAKHGMPGAGPSIVIQTIQFLTSTFPNLQIEVKMMLAEADKVMVFMGAKGRQVAPFFGIPSKGHEIELSGVDIFRIKGNQIVEQWSVTDQLDLMRQITRPISDPGSKALLPVEKVISFTGPLFLESLVQAPNGSLLVSSLYTSTIYEIDSDGNQRVFFHTTLDKRPGLNGVFCMVFADDDRLFVTVNSTDPEKHGVWLLDMDGKGQPFARLPRESIANGIAWHPDGNLLVADSLTGTIWEVDSSTAVVSPWLRDPLIAPRLYLAQFPGANGIQVNKNFVYVANSDKGNMIRIPILADGSAGVPVVAVTELGGDDFAVGPDGTLYVTTHPFNTVVRVLPNGQRQTIVNADQGVLGPTAAILVSNNEGNFLYVTTDGGMYTLPQDPVVPVSEQNPGVYRVRLPD